MKLSIELVPKTSWYNNLRDILTSSEWEQCKKYSKQQSNGVCIICGGKGEQWATECHEEWKYDDKTNIQSLSNILALCPKCHLVKHIGYAQISGKYKIAFEQFKKINEIKNNSIANDYIEGVFELWSRRSSKKWKVNISYLLEIKEIKLSKETLEKIKDLMSKQ